MDRVLQSGVLARRGIPEATVTDAAVAHASREKTKVKGLRKLLEARSHVREAPKEWQALLRENMGEPIGAHPLWQRCGLALDSPLLREH